MNRILEQALAWAVQLATPGEATAKTLARAEAFKVFLERGVASDRTRDWNSPVSEQYAVAQKNGLA